MTSSKLAKKVYYWWKTQESRKLPIYIRRISLSLIYTFIIFNKIYNGHYYFIKYPLYTIFLIHLCYSISLLIIIYIILFKKKKPLVIGDIDLYEIIKKNDYPNPSDISYLDIVFDENYYLINIVREILLSYDIDLIHQDMIEETLSWRNSNLDSSAKIKSSDVVDFPTP